MEKINISQQYTITPLPLLRNTYRLKNRMKINALALLAPQKVEKIAYTWLAPVASEIKGFLFSFDYGVLPRILLKVCRQLNIPTILIPHESVFFNEEKYYFHPITHSNFPLCDQVLCWGALQKEIFIKRGYPANRIIMTRSPKLDTYYNFKPGISREEFYKKAQFNSNKPIIAYIAQTFDVQLHQKTALIAQKKIIRHLMEFCIKNDYQFYLRFPPTQFPILSKKDVYLLKVQGCSIDTSSTKYCFTPDEVLYYSDIIISVNSTMLIEALLMHKKVLSVRYFEFNSAWSRQQIPCVYNKDELFEKLQALKDTNKHLPNSNSYEWAQKAYSPEKFDGKASQRIQQILERYCHTPTKKLSSGLERFMQKQSPGLDIVHLPLLPERYHAISKILQARKEVHNYPACLRYLADFRVNVPDIPQIKPTSAAQLYVCEAPFHQEKQVNSFIVDTVGYYVESDKETYLQTLLNGTLQIQGSEQEYAARCIQTILQNQLSSAITQQNQTIRPLIPPDTKNILLIDQFSQDFTARFGKVKKSQFQLMLETALKNHPEANVIIACYPETRNNRQTSSFLSPKNIKSLNLQDYNIYWVGDYFHPFELFKIAQHIFVVNSFIGFEAVMAGRNVECFGTPFYANWGLTIDHLTQKAISKKRSMVEIFYVLFVILGRYYHPHLQHICLLHEYLNYQSERELKTEEVLKPEYTEI